MIDIEKAKRFYKTYLSNYDAANERVAMKMKHIYRVGEKAKWIAQELKLSQEDVLLAELIGLLHDFGRFEQYKRYHTYSDKESIDHAALGVELLFEDGYIRNFIEEDTYDSIIRTAIFHHNKFKIGDVKDERTLTHCKIIRDADKLDIFHILIHGDLRVAYPLEKYPKEGITPEIKEKFKDYHLVESSKRKTCADYLAHSLGFVFDIYYLPSLMEIKQKNYLAELVKKYDAQEETTKEDLNDILMIADKYVQEKINEGETCLKNY